MAGAGSKAEGAVVVAKIQQYRNVTTEYPWRCYVFQAYRPIATWERRSELFQKICARFKLFLGDGEEFDNNGGSLGYAIDFYNVNDFKEIVAKLYKYKADLKLSFDLWHANGTTKLKPGRVAKL